MFGFAVGQNYSKMLKIVEPLILLLFCVIRPLQIKEICQSNRTGKELGKQAKCLLIYRFEENWSRPIGDIRVELGLVSKNIAAINTTAEIQSQTEVTV